MTSSFEWNKEKNEENLKKHGIDFNSAEYAFLDPKRIIAEDKTHSDREKRYYCFGKMRGGVLTVRFTYRKSKIRIIGAGFWRKGKSIYEKQNNI